MTPAITAAARIDAATSLHGFSDLRAIRDHAALKVIQQGKGVWVMDEHGRPMLEAAAGMWCASLGFGDEELVDAAIEQMRTLPYYHTVGGKSVVPSGALAERLLENSPIRPGKVYFACTGSEANDFLVKFVRYGNNAVGEHRRKTFLARVNGYHGGTLAASSLTGMAQNHRGFDLPLPGFLHLSEPHYYRNALPGESEAEFCARLVDELRQVIEREGADTVAGFVAEPVCAAGGVLIPPSGYYAGVQRVLREYGIPFFADEVVTGIGRLGTMFGCEALDIQPAAVTLGKGLTGAYFPLAAMIVDDEIVQRLLQGSDQAGSYFAHGATYAGHPVGCAIALALLEIVRRRGILAHVRRVSEVFASRIRQLAGHPLVGDARSVGLMGAVELRPPQGAGQACAGIDLARQVHAVAETEYGLIFRKLANNVCAFSPPLVISEHEIDELFDRFGMALDRVWRTGGTE
ncbi:Adenosylmethionine-8-amino-7-oxononanoate aminotransferase [Cupriavidus oxalaticus]